MKFSVRTIPAAAAMTAALIFGAHAQAQTSTSPATGSGAAAPMAADPNAPGSTTGGAMQQRDAGSANTGGSANIPAGPNTTSKTMEQRDAAKPMARDGAAAGSTATGDSSRMGATSDQPVRQSSKVAKNKAERMSKGDRQKSSKNKSGQPVREADIKDQPTR